jgi:hypothetical protein
MLMTRRRGERVGSTGSHRVGGLLRGDNTFRLTWRRPLQHRTERDGVSVVANVSGAPSAGAVLRRRDNRGLGVPCWP